MVSARGFGAICSPAVRAAAELQSWPAKGLASGRRTGLRSVFAQCPFGEPYLLTIGRVRPEDVHNAFVSLGARPILLQLEDILQRRDGHSAGLDKPIHCTLMCFGRDVSAGICRDIDLEAFLQEFEPDKHHAGLGPQAGDGDLLSTGRIDGFAKFRVEPGIHRSAVDEGVPGEKRTDLRHERSGKRILRYRCDDRRDAEELGGLRQNLDIVKGHQTVVRLHALIHRRLIVDESDRMVLWAQHFELGHGHLLNNWPIWSRASKAGRWSSIDTPKTERMERHAFHFWKRACPFRISRAGRSSPKSPKPALSPAPPASSAFPARPCPRHCNASRRASASA